MEVIAQRHDPAMRCQNCGAEQDWRQRWLGGGKFDFVYEACGDLPPAELAAAYYRQNAALTEAGQTTK